jgi:hypothetical protein
MRRAPETHTAAQNRRGRVSDGSRSYGRSKVPRHKGQRHMTAGDVGGRDPIRACSPCPSDANEGASERGRPVGASPDWCKCEGCRSLCGCRHSNCRPR